MRLSIAALAGVALTLALAGCAASASPSAATSSQSTYVVKDHSPEDVIDVSLVNHYTDLASIYAGTETVVEARLVGSKELTISDVSFTVAEFKVENVIAGADPGATIKVRYTGDSDVAAKELPQLPLDGLEYLLALQPFEGPKADPVGEWTVVGPGQWARQSDDQRFGLDTLEADPAVPISLSADEAASGWAVVAK